MGWIDAESLRLFCPDFADKLEGREALQGLKPAGEVVGVYGVGEVSSELVVGLLVVSLHRRFLERSVHSLDLAVGPRMARLGEPMVNVQLGAGVFEGMRPDGFACPYGGLDVRSG